MKSDPLEGRDKMNKIEKGKKMSQYVCLGTSFREWYCKLFSKYSQPLMCFGRTRGDFKKLDDSISAFVLNWYQHNLDEANIIVHDSPKAYYFCFTKRKYKSLLQECKKELQRQNVLPIHDDGQLRSLSELISMIEMTLNNTNWLVSNCIMKLGDFQSMLVKAI